MKTKTGVSVHAIHGVDEDHLAHVKAEMLRLGPPTIEVVECGDHYVALEGSHRLAAAHALDVSPILVVHAHDDPLDITCFDWYENNTSFISGEQYLAGEVAGELTTRSAVPYSFEVVTLK